MISEGFCASPGKRESAFLDMTVISSKFGVFSFVVVNDHERHIKKLGGFILC
jgi:hypothetical protein